MKVIIFCVNYNSYDELNAYLESLRDAVKDCKMELTVIVADNSKIIEELRSGYDFELIHINTNGNLGYFGGAIYGIQNCGKKLSGFDYIIISNVDLQVDKEFFHQLSCLQTTESIGCIAPRIFSIGENRDRNPKVLERYSLRKLKVLRLMYKFPVLDYLYRTIFFTKRRQHVENSTQEYIYAAHGSFMLFTKQFSGFLQTMKYPVFMFGEEVFIAENLIRNGLKTIYKPELKVWDNDHASTSKMKNSFYYKCNYEAIDMLVKEYFHE